jgi:lysophospholipase L1-like esterase
MKATGHSALTFRVLCVFAILLAVGAAGYKTRAVLETTKGRTYTRSETIILAAREIDGDFVLVLGDSIVEGSALPASVCGIPILNGGVSGARASTLLPLLEDITVSAKGPKLVIIAVGVNNAATAYWDKRAFEIAYGELLRKALSVSRAAVATVTPVDVSQEVGKTVSAAARDDINQFIIAAAKQFALGIIRLDQLSTKEPLTLDGVHLGSEAKAHWLSKVLNEAALALGCSSSLLVRSG